MSDVFAHIYLDEDVHVLIATLVQNAGFGATTTREAGNLEFNDAAQLAYAATHGMTLLTHNRKDFEGLAQMYFDQGWSHAGIIIAVRRSPYEVVARLLDVLNDLTADEIADQIIYI